MEYENSNIYNILKIIRGTTVDGPGFRTSIYISGCNHQCPKCHNPHSWDPEAGEPMTIEKIIEIIEEEDFDVTLTGGDPLYNPQKIKKLISEIKKNRRNLWVYTGYTWEEIIANSLLKSAISQADVLVDGTYIDSLRNIDLPFRGSSNQRIIDIQASLSLGEIIEIER